MLPLRSILKVTRQMNLYGDVRTGALDFLASRLSGHRDENGMHNSSSTSTPSGKGFVRKWDEATGAYIFIEE